MKLSHWLLSFNVAVSETNQATVKCAESPSSLQQRLKHIKTQNTLMMKSHLCTWLPHDWLTQLLLKFMFVALTKRNTFTFSLRKSAQPTGKPLRICSRLLTGNFAIVWAAHGLPALFTWVSWSSTQPATRSVSQITFSDEPRTAALKSRLNPKISIAKKVNSSWLLGCKRCVHCFIYEYKGLRKYFSVDG